MSLLFLHIRLADIFTKGLFLSVMYMAVSGDVRMLASDILGHFYSLYIVIRTETLYLADTYCVSPNCPVSQRLPAQWVPLWVQE